jgi:hypothetical protein
MNTRPNIIEMWKAGFDTWLIAKRLKRTESEVEQNINQYLDLRWLSKTCTA